MKFSKTFDLFGPQCLYFLVIFPQLHLGVWPLILYRNILSKQLSGIWAGQVGSILRSQLMACNLDHNWIRLCHVIMSRFWFHIGFQPCGALWLLGAGLGPPGNDGASWAGDATVLFNEAARRLETRDFGAIFSRSFSDSPRPNSVKRHKKTFCRRLLSGSPEVESSCNTKHSPNQCSFIASMDFQIFHDITEGTTACLVIVEICWDCNTGSPPICFAQSLANIVQAFEDLSTL